MTLYPEGRGEIKCVYLFWSLKKAGRRRRCGKFRWKMKAANFSSMTFLSMLSLATVGSSVVQKRHLGLEYLIVLNGLSLFTDFGIFQT